MDRLFLFFAGAFAANSIPHFVNGISGREFVKPFLYRFVLWMPNPLFNVIWGILFMIMSMMLFQKYKSLHPNFTLTFGFNSEFVIALIGFVSVSVLLSIFFSGGGWRLPA